MEERKYKKVCMAACIVMGLTCCFCTLVLGGVNLWELAGQARSLSGRDGLRAAGPMTDRPVIVIDPGHGGMDGGAVAAGGAVEKDLTLAISRALAEEMADYPVDVIMTRSEDTGLYAEDAGTVKERKREDLLRRKEIIEGAGADLAVSVHLNSFPQDASVYGAQVFYPKEHEGRTDVPDAGRTSVSFAEEVQKSLEINIDDGRKRTVMAKDDILLFKNINTSIILVECGFLSNETEAEKLLTAEYQRLLAHAIWEGINEILCLSKQEKMQIIYSANKNL